MPIEGAAGVRHVPGIEESKPGAGLGPTPQKGAVAGRAAGADGSGFGMGGFAILTSGVCGTTRGAS